MELASLITDVSARGDSTVLDRHLTQGYRIRRQGYWMVGALILPALVWLAMAPLASSVVATGVVKVDLNRAVVQHVEGGTVSVVHVRDGQRVKKGDPLLELGDVSVNADKTRLTQRRFAERAGQARLEAEQDRRAALVFPADLLEAGEKDPVVKEQLGKEQSLFKARLISLDSSVALMKSQREMIRREMDAMRTSMRSIQESVGVQTRQLELNQRLAKDGVVSDTQVMDLESRIADYRSRIAQSDADLTRADQRIGDIGMRINQLENDYRAQASDQLKATMARIQEVEQELRKAADASRRQIITAPVDGEVIGLRVNTPGAVLMPRDTIAEIVPADPRLIVEAQIQVQDISRVQKGQQADLRLSAFAYRTTDMAKGLVSYVGADRLVQKEANNMPYYLVTIDVDPQSVKNAVHERPDAKLQAGMPVDVYLRGEDRTVLRYLLEPLTQLFRNAGRQH